MNLHSSVSRQGTRAQLFVMLLLGTILGLGVGFWLGRKTAAEKKPSSKDGTNTQLEQQVLDGGLPPGATSSNGTAETRTDSEKREKNQDSITDSNVNDKSLVRHLSASISGSLYSTLASKLSGRDADILSAQIGRILVWWLDATREVLKGDHVSVSFEPAEGPGKYRILALVYKSSKLGKTLEAIFFKPNGAKYGRYFDAKGVEIEERLKHSPIDDYEQITEIMNLGGRRHHGVDFKTDIGTPVSTPFDARVMRRNWRTRRNGNCLHLHYVNKGIDALFLHLSEILVKPGQRIKAGTIVAKSGNTGHSTAPHLHYELHGKGGRLLNPFKVFEVYRRKLKGQALEHFLEHRKALLKELQGEAGDTSAEDR